ncbi:hypothetical protein AVEN_54935-1 [Araneus ventricosus]|uniref:Uncharacterized protein n=1 Tax=Araneus ventricosus TaxID=182803 RepID=A0A4Y2E4E4_ARAVE|nr:hypothetical protein AVEN_273376-1 [Araneus ventricosus]GBM24023.1 hypothetical protein AVEN_47768-1 [Araneus ventricosus]GBM24319.1 hypothetical protein AVEN_54935-1 [Araneus ventricosus]
MVTTVATWSQVHKMLTQAFRCFVDEYSASKALRAAFVLISHHIFFLIHRDPLIRQIFFSLFFSFSAPDQKPKKISPPRTSQPFWIPAVSRQVHAKPPKS